MKEKIAIYNKVKKMRTNLMSAFFTQLILDQMLSDFSFRFREKRNFESKNEARKLARISASGNAILPAT